MTGREKLIELLKQDNCPSPMFCSDNCKYINSSDCATERLADHLLANGVIVIDANSVKRENLPLIQQAFNMPLDELAKLIEAKQAGRIVELPCKVGDVVYCVNKMRSGHWEEDKYVVDDEGEWKIYEKRFNLVLYAAGDYYLTKADAEKAVAKETAQNGLAYATPNFELLEG